MPHILLPWSAAANESLLTQSEDIMIALLILAGLCFIGTAVFGFFLLRGYRSRNWPAVRATIKESNIEDVWVMTNNVPIRTFELKVQYEYEFQGNSYTGKRLGKILSSASSPKQAKELEEKYPVGLELQVHVDPQNPEMAVVGPGVHPALLITTILFAGGTLMLLLLALNEAAGIE